MTAPADELLPCPFCGGSAEIVHIDEGENQGGSCVCCTRCMASSNVEFEFKENFVANWNRRTELRERRAQAVTVRALAWISAHSLALLQRDESGTVWPNESGAFTTPLYAAAPPAQAAGVEVEVVAWGIEGNGDKVVGAHTSKGSPYTVPLVRKSDYDALVAAKDAEIAAAREALEPFADLAEKHHSGLDDAAYAIKLVTVGDLRKARSTLAALKHEGDAG